MHIIDPLSKEFVRVPIAASESGVAIDVTTQAVVIAVVATGTKPGVSDWKTAEWETDASPDPDLYYARLLIGPSSGNVTLTGGLVYDVYVKVTDNPEIPVRNAGAVAAF